MSKQQQLNINVDIKNSTAIKSPEGNQVFQEGVILRKVSKFITGTSEDGIIPIPVFFDVKTGKVLVELLPKELRAEFEVEDDNIRLF
jgi:hypothetical protein